MPIPTPPQGGIHALKVRKTAPVLLKMMYCQVFSSGDGNESSNQLIRLVGQQNNNSSVTMGVGYSHFMGAILIFPGTLEMALPYDSDAWPDVCLKSIPGERSFCFFWLFLQLAPTDAHYTIDFTCYMHGA